MPKAQKFLANESGIHKRLFDPSSRSSANLQMQPVLRSFARPDFLVVFESCSRKAVRLGAGTGPENLSLRARFL